MKDKLLSAFIFGIDEQLITLCAVLSGYLSFPQKKIIIALIIMAFSNSLPDCASYYDEKISDDKMDKSQALKLTSMVFISEMMSTIIVLIPIILIKNTKKAIITSYVLIFSMILYAHYYRSKNIEESIMKLPIYASIGIILWLISTGAQKYFNISV